MCCFAAAVGVVTHTTINNQVLTAPSRGMDLELQTQQQRQQEVNPTV
jgi:hypothetical protein